MTTHSSGAVGSFQILITWCCLIPMLKGALKISLSTQWCHGFSRIISRSNLIWTTQILSEIYPNLSEHWMRRDWMTTDLDTMRRQRVLIGFCTAPIIVAPDMSLDFMLGVTHNGWSSFNQASLIIQIVCSRESTKNGKVVTKTQRMSRSSFLSSSWKTLISLKTNKSLTLAFVLTARE